MRAALNQLSVKIEKSIRLPIQFNAPMRAAIDIGMELLVMVDDKERQIIEFKTTARAVGNVFCGTDLSHNDGIKLGNL